MEYKWFSVGKGEIGRWRKKDSTKDVVKLSDFVGARAVDPSPELKARNSKSHPR